MHLGTSIDGFFKVKTPNSLEVSRSSRVAIHEYADGSTSATVFGSMMGNEVWDVGYDYAPANSLSLIDSMSSDPEWHKRGTGIQFLPTGGEQVNLLTREEVEMRTNTYYSGQTVATDEGPVLGFVSTGDVNTRTIVGNDIPVIQGVSAYIFSAYVKSTARVLLYWRDVAGNTIGGSVGLNMVGDNTYTRKTAVFRNPPAGAVYMLIQMAGAFTRPALTVGDTLRPFGVGQRLNGVVVESGDGGVEWAGDKGPGSQVYVSRNYTITELGA